MRILAIVPARAGSKRVPNKNTRMIGGKPLIKWTLDLIENFSDIDQIIISTDSEEVVCASKGSRAIVPWLRPVELSADDSTQYDVAVHALNWFQSERGIVDAIILLQPTSPFRKLCTLKKAIQLFKKYPDYAIVGVSLSDSHPLWSFRDENGCLFPYISEHGFGIRSQDLPSVYVLNGSFYLISVEHFLKTQSFIGSKRKKILVESQVESLDIDTEFDVQVAQMIVSVYGEQLIE